MNAPARTPTPGDNLRPPLTSPDQLGKDFSHIAKLVEDLAERGNKFPPVIEDEEDLALANKLVADCRTETDKIERTREAEKRPYLDAGRVVDGYFKVLTTRLDRMKAAINDRATRYLNKKAADEQKRRDEEARVAQAEADRIAKAAMDAAAKAPAPTAETKAAMTQASQAQMRADDKASAAQAPRADLARTRTESGTATLVDDWQFEITNYDQIDLNKLRPYLSRPDVEKAIRRHVGIHKDAQPVAGVRIFNSPKARMA